jgi:hypothetical protein
MQTNLFAIPSDRPHSAKRRRSSAQAAELNANANFEHQSSVLDLASSAPALPAIPSSQSHPQISILTNIESPPIAPRPPTAPHASFASAAPNSCLKKAKTPRAASIAVQFSPVTFVRPIPSWRDQAAAIARDEEELGARPQTRSQIGKRKEPSFPVRAIFFAA